MAFFGGCTETQRATNPGGCTATQRATNLGGTATQRAANLGRIRGFLKKSRVSKLIWALMAIQYFVAATGIVVLTMEYMEHGNIHRYPSEVNNFGDLVERHIAKRSRSANETFEGLPSWVRDPLVGDCEDVPEDGVVCGFDLDEEPRARTMTIFMLSFLVGTFGVGRCAAGYWWIGITKCVTCGGFGLWWLLDWIFLLTVVWMRDANGCCFQDNIGL